MGKMQRDKGHNFEREMANILKEVFPNAKRGIGQARSASEVPDVDGTPFWVECKRGRMPNVRAAIRQAQEATDGRPYLVVVRDDYAPAFVTMSLETFLDLMRKP
jgi:Holliday junction resolvase